MLRHLIRSGMDVARLNFSHGDAETHRENVERIRLAAKTENRPVAIQIDLQGPKFRMGKIVDSGVPVNEGDTVTLTTEDLLGRTREALPVQNERLPTLVKPGDQILIDDGLIELIALSTTEHGIQCQVVVGGSIKSNKGMNLPGVSTELPSMTEKDYQDLAHALDWDVDWIALSFVRTAGDVDTLKSYIEEHTTDRPIPVMAKIEKPEALERIDEVVEAADAIMVARGDLGIEIPTEQVPMAQKHIIERCNEAGIPVVTATQMLDSMIRNPRPTRAEASDVANAMLDGTDAVMLSGETTIGRYPVEALQTMVRIIDEVEGKRAAIPIRPFRPLEESINLSIARAISRAAREAAQDLGTAAILAITSSGYTARIVSRYRPSAPIIAITPDERVQRQLNLYWGVTPLLAPRTQNTDEMIDNALQTVKKWGLVEKDDLVAIMAGTAGSDPGTTNLLRIQIIP
jgi:pyruvate kinase